MGTGRVPQSRRATRRRCRLGDAATKGAAGRAALMIAVVLPLRESAMIARTSRSRDRWAVARETASLTGRGRLGSTCPVRLPKAPRDHCQPSASRAIVSIMRAAATG